MDGTQVKQFRQELVARLPAASLVASLKEFDKAVAAVGAGAATSAAAVTSEVDLTVEECVTRRRSLTTQIIEKRRAARFERPKLWAARISKDALPGLAQMLVDSTRAAEKLEGVFSVSELNTVGSAAGTKIDEVRTKLDEASVIIDSYVATVGVPAESSAMPVAMAQIKTLTEQFRKDFVGMIQGQLSPLVQSITDRSVAFRGRAGTASTMVANGEADYDKTISTAKTNITALESQEQELFKQREEVKAQCAAIMADPRDTEG